MEAVLIFWCGAVDTRNVVWIGTVLGVLAVLMVVGYMLVKRFTVSGRREKEENTVFTLEQVLQLRREGQLSDEECKALNDSIIQNAGVTLEQIRQLHQEGQLSDEEYQSLREKIIQEARLG